MGLFLEFGGRRSAWGAWFSILVPPVSRRVVGWLLWLLRASVLGWTLKWTRHPYGPKGSGAVQGASRQHKRVIGLHRLGAKVPVQSRPGAQPASPNHRWPRGAFNLI